MRLCQPRSQPTQQPDAPPLINNPSLPLDNMTLAFYQSNAMLIICPKVATDATLVQAATAYYNSLLSTLTWEGDHTQVRT